MKTNPTIFGYTWEEIQAGQQGDMRAMRGSVDLSKPAKRPATEKDHALLAEHGADGLRRLGMFGVLDRLNLPFN